MEPGDSIIPDRGVDIEHDIPPDVTIKRPPFLRANAQLELKYKLKTGRTAFVRVHIERSVAHIKNHIIL